MLRELARQAGALLLPAALQGLPAEHRHRPVPPPGLQDLWVLLPLERNRCGCESPSCACLPRRRHHQLQAPQQQAAWPAGQQAAAAQLLLRQVRPALAPRLQAGVLQKLLGRHC